MPKPTLPPSILLALGLGACKDGVGPCLDVAVEVDTDTDPFIDTGPCLDFPLPSGDTAVTPCLSPPLPTGDTGVPPSDTNASDTGTATETGLAPCLSLPPPPSTHGHTSATPEPKASTTRERLIEQLVDLGVLSTDMAHRLGGGS